MNGVIVAEPIVIADENSNLLVVTSTGEAKVSDIIDNGGVHGAIIVGTSAVEAKVGGSVLADRKLLTIFHNGNGRLYWGYDNTITTSNGTQIFKNTMFAIPAGQNTSVWLIADSAGQDVRITEGA